MRTRLLHLNWVPKFQIDKTIRSIQSSTSVPAESLIFRIIFAVLNKTFAIFRHSFADNILNECRGWQTAKQKTNRLRSFGIAISSNSFQTCQLHTLSHSNCHICWIYFSQLHVLWPSHTFSNISGNHRSSSSLMFWMFKAKRVKQHIYKRTSEKNIKRKKTSLKTSSYGVHGYKMFINWKESIPHYELTHTCSCNYSAGCCCVFAVCSTYGTHMCACCAI